jgi:hypothetical protein
MFDQPAVDWKNPDYIAILGARERRLKAIRAGKIDMKDIHELRRVCRQL